MTTQWERTVRAVAEAPVVLVIGESDTGKTTLVTALANAALAAGRAVGILDTDLGQSEIGPPTTAGLGRVTAPIGRPADATVLALEFVGVTSPARNVLGALVAARRLADRARAAALDRLVVDTSGLVAGGLGRILKQAKIELLDPDVVIALERGDECEAILGPYARGARPRVVRLRAVATRRRTQDERRRFREERLAAHFAGARDVALDLTRVTVRLPGGEVAADAGAVAAFAGRLTGLEDETRRTLGLGVVRAIEDGRRLRVFTAVPAGVTTVRIGRESYGGGGQT